MIRMSCWILRSSLSRPAFLCNPHGLQVRDEYPNLDLRYIAGSSKDRRMSCDVCVGISKLRDHPDDLGQRKVAA